MLKLDWYEWLLAAILVFGLASCGLLTAALGSSGYAPNANTPEAKEAAREADDKALDWLYWILLGGAVVAGAGTENVRQRRRARRQATVRS